MSSSGQRGAANAATTGERRPAGVDFAGRWRTSSYSGGGNECVAVATTSAAGGRGGWVAVRDTKCGAGGPVIVTRAGAVAALVDWVR